MAKKGKSKATANDTATSSAVDSPEVSSPSKSNTTGDLKRSDISVSTTKSNDEGVATLQDEDTTTEELPDVLVNKWSMHELKTACDDALKQVGARPVDAEAPCCTQRVGHGLRAVADLLRVLMLRLCLVHDSTCRSPRYSNHLTYTQMFGWSWAGHPPSSPSRELYMPTN